MSKLFEYIDIYGIEEDVLILVMCDVVKEYGILSCFYYLDLCISMLSKYF